MSRIYQSQQAGNRYKGADKSQRFAPVQAVSDEKALTQYKNARIQDSQTMGRELVRQQKQESQELQASQQSERGQLGLEQLSDKQGLASEQFQQKGNLALEQGFERGQLGLEAAQQQAKSAAASARTKLIGTAITGLLSFAGSAVQFQQSVQDQAVKTEIEDAQLEQAGLGSTFGGIEPITNERIAESANTDALTKAESSAINNVVTTEFDPNNALDAHAALELKQATLWKKLEPVRGAGYAATAMYGVALEEAKASGLIRPGVEGLVDAQNFSREFAKQSGILGAPRDIQLAYARQAAAANQNMVSAVTAEHKASVEQANQATWQGNTSNIVDSASVQDIGLAFETTYQEAKHGNIGFNGVDGRALTETNLKEVLSNLQVDGKTGHITELRKHVYNSATGRTLGQDFDDLFDTAERTARNTSIQNFNLKSNEQTLQIKEQIQIYNSDPSTESKLEAIEGLRSIGSIEAIEAANRLVDKGLNYDPEMVVEMAINPPSPSEAKMLVDTGVITAEQGKPYMASPELKAVQGFLKEIDGDLEKGMYGQVNPSNVSASTKAEVAIRHEVFMEELEGLVMAEINIAPDRADNKQELSRLINEKSQYLLNQPRYVLEQDAKAGAVFGAGMDKDRRLLPITNAGGNQDFSKLRSEDLFSNGFPMSEMNPSRDRFIALSTLERDSLAILQGKAPSERTAGIAQRLGLSSRAFVDQQLRVNGITPLREMQLSDPIFTKPSVTGTDYDARTGFQALMDLNVPRKGAAYLAGNIQQESSWDGMRDWGQVKNPTTGQMDGTNRNGGLVSWASWTNNSARLGQIEAKYGRPIDQITESEQLTYMLQEMESSYPRSYATFMNPNSSETELRRASFNFWGYGHRGDRFNYATALLNGTF